MPRFDVVNGSETGHCCFRYSVVDTWRNPLSPEYPICECFEQDWAFRICEALNLRERERVPTASEDTRHTE